MIYSSHSSEKVKKVNEINFLFLPIAAFVALTTFFYVLIVSIDAANRKITQKHPRKKNVQSPYATYIPPELKKDTYEQYKSVVPAAPVSSVTHKSTHSNVARVTPEVRHEQHSRANTSRGPIMAEDEVESALRGLNEPRYFVFRDLIIPSYSRDLSLTQIDHVVVSRYGIFCIETKSHHGDIYGYSRTGSWKQYLHNKEYNFNSPFRQNGHHVRALEVLLGQNLRAPVHSYIAFPNATKVVVDGAIEDMSPYGVVSKINNHTEVIYDPPAIERIAKTLAHAATYRDELRDRHAEEVREYVEAKVSHTLKLS